MDKSEVVNQYNNMAERSRSLVLTALNDLSRDMSITSEKVMEIATASENRDLTLKLWGMYLTKDPLFFEIVKRNDWQPE